MNFTRRLNHIFRPDGRTLIFAYDHGMVLGPAPGLVHPAEMLTQVAAGGADAVLASYGIATRFAAEMAGMGLILRVDGGGTRLTKIGPNREFFTVDDALRLDADAVAVCAYPGAANEEATLANLAEVVREAHAWNLPVMAEMVPGGFDAGPDFRTTEAVAISARVGAELGADLIKIPAAPDFGRIAQTCYAPVVLLGGARDGDERGMLESIRASLDAGAAGVAIGRNIFQAEHPAAMTAAIAALVHDDASVEEAYAILHVRPL